MRAHFLGTGGCSLIWPWLYSFVYLPSPVFSVALGCALREMFPLIYHCCPYLNQVLEGMLLLTGEWGKGWTAFLACFLPVETWGPKYDLEEYQTLNPGWGLFWKLPYVFLTIWLSQIHVLITISLILWHMHFSLDFSIVTLSLMGFCGTTSLVSSCGESPSEPFCFIERVDWVKGKHLFPLLTIHWMVLLYFKCVCVFPHQAIPQFSVRTNPVSYSSA